MAQPVTKSSNPLASSPSHAVILACVAGDVQGLKAALAEGGSPKAIARNDAKRLEDVLARVGGIDAEAMFAALSPTVSSPSMIKEFGSSASLAMRTLARCPAEVFEAMAESMGFARFPVVFNNAKLLGIGREPRAVAKLAAACGSKPSECNQILAFASPEILDPVHGSPASESQRRQWPAAASEVEEVLVGHFQAMGPKAIVAIKVELPPWHDVRILDRALAEIERSCIAQEAGVESTARAAKAASL